MGSKMIFVWDCCQREADNNFGWARMQVSGDEKLMVVDENYDLCAICWSPLKTLMDKLAAEAQEKLKADS
jgi:hypothetical protein